MRGRTALDRQLFFPAETMAEAIARIYSLTGAADGGTRGRSGQSSPCVMP